MDDLSFSDFSWSWCCLKECVCNGCGWCLLFSVSWFKLIECWKDNKRWIDYYVVLYGWGGCCVIKRLYWLIFMVIDVC